jgi:iron complex outermembrane receptor protein
MDLPQSIATVSETVIRDQQAQRLSDVVKNVNGVYLSSARASTQESFYARGYSFSSTNMFKNGSRVNSGVMPEVSSLESVEILKGSAAILYGNVSPGGILNMITKKPKFAFGGEVSMRAGSFNLWKPSIDLYGPLTKKIAYRLNATYESANSYRDQVSSTRYYINPSFLFKLGNKTELIVEGDYFKHDFTPDFGIGSLDNTNIPDVPRSRFMGTSWQYNISRQTTSSATIKHVFNNNWQLNSILSYQVFSRDYYAVERIQAKANGDWARPLGIIHTKEKYNTGQVNVTGKFNTGKLEHAILAGMDADHYLTQAYNYDVQGKIYDSINILEPSKYVQSIDIPAGGFTTIDITAGYSRKRFSLLAKVANLGNVLNYYVHENYSINPIAPRSFVTTVAYGF